MASPKPGDGQLTYTVGQVLPIGVMYLAPYAAGANTYTASAAPPGVKLGTADPGGTYVKVGLLKDDAFSVEETDAEVIEYRRGFRQRYYGEVVRKAGQRSINAKVIEVEPASIASLLGETLGSVGGSPFTGQYEFVGTSEQIHHTLFIDYFEALSGQEFHIYSPHVITKFKMTKDAEFMSLDITNKLITYLDANGRYKDMQYYIWF